MELVVNERKNCSICGKLNFSEVLDLPNLPLTGRFTKQPAENFIPGIDQKLLFCVDCGHAQLFRQINPSVLYDTNYSFKTSLSATARTGTGFYLRFLKSLNIEKKFKCILDVGCNDLYLLQELKDYGKLKVGIDPIWLSQDCQHSSDFKVIGGTVEDSNLSVELPEKPDLVVCRHTLEHIYDPVKVILKLMDCCDDDALYVFEVPCFDSLVNRIRFDQVFHEHLQYFSLSSWEKLMEQCGAEIIDISEDYHNWGAVALAFKKKKRTHGDAIKPYRKISAKEISQKLKIFKLQMENSAEILGLLKGNIYGYGAALMLPVLAYHLKMDLSILTSILDDDKDKDGWFYENLPLQIVHRSKIMDLEKSSVLLTALDNVKPIMTKLLEKRPKHIIYPLHVI
jgi:hypothetical protein